MNCVPNTLNDNDEKDWKTNDVLRVKGWSVVKADFYRAHERLMEYADTCNEDFLNKKYENSEFTNKDILFGLIQHDAYHLGQIGLTIKLLKSKL